MVVDLTGSAIHDVRIIKIVDCALREEKNKRGKNHDKRKSEAAGCTEVSF